jgi:antirestriction protein ArdC
MAEILLVSSLQSDIIKMPEIGTFQSAEHYYATAFHELTHWTSDKNRCNRDISKGRFGNPDYAFEELVAELGAAFLCGNHGIKGDLRHAGYIESWLKCLKNDPKAIFKASGLAQSAADYILALTMPKPLLKMNCLPLNDLPLPEGFRLSTFGD